MNLTHEQLQAIANGQAVPVVIGGSRCVIVREDVYRDVDYSPWTIEEMNALADEAEAIISQSEADEPTTR